MTSLYLLRPHNTQSHTMHTPAGTSAERPLPADRTDGQIQDGPLGLGAFFLPAEQRPVPARALWHAGHLLHGPLRRGHRL